MMLWLQKFSKMKGRGISCVPLKLSDEERSKVLQEAAQLAKKYHSEEHE